MLPGQEQTWLVTQQRARFGNVCKRMTHIPGTEITIAGSETAEMRETRLQFCADGLEQNVQRCTITYGNVVDLISSIVMLRRGGQQIGLYGVGYIAKIADGLAITIDEN